MASESAGRIWSVQFGAVDWIAWARSLIPLIALWGVALFVWERNSVMGVVRVSSSRPSARDNWAP